MTNATPKRARILLAEDDPDHQETIGSYLRRHGFQVSIVGDGLRALEFARSTELLILDLGLPGLEGMEVLRRLRIVSKVPVLILSARKGGSERVLGLRAGADDYLEKPFLPDELLARVDALLRRSRLPATSAPSTGPLVLDEEARMAFLQGQQLSLSPKEFELLRVLSKTPSKTFTREELLDRVWGPEQLDARRVNLYVSKLRAKLRRPGLPVLIKSVWGVGYRYGCIQ